MSISGSVGSQGSGGAYVCAKCSGGAENTMMELPVLDLPPGEFLEVPIVSLSLHLTINALLIRNPERHIPSLLSHCHALAVGFTGIRRDGRIE